jgi:ATP synthase protein I
MHKVVFLQFAFALLAGVASWFLWGTAGALSALLGGAACALPTAMFAWRLNMGLRRGTGTHPVSFLIGEAVKVAGTIGILVAVRLLFPEAHWGAVVLGLMLTLQANFLAFLVKL